MRSEMSAVVKRSEMEGMRSDVSAVKSDVRRLGEVVEKHYSKGAQSHTATSSAHGESFVQMFESPLHLRKRARKFVADQSSKLRDAFRSARGKLVTGTVLGKVSDDDIDHAEQLNPDEFGYWFRIAGQEVMVPIIIHEEVNALYVDGYALDYSNIS